MNNIQTPRIALVKTDTTKQKMSNSEEQTSELLPPAKKFRHEQGQLKSTEELYLKPRFADVHFSFVSDDGTAVRVPAHKYLLAADSDVFEKMFYGDLKEQGDVAITDVSGAAFKEFLQFFYLSKMSLSAAHMPSILYLGNKYNVEKCVEGCVKIMKEDLTNENVCATLSSAILYGHKDLMKACEKRILLNTTKVFATAGFLACDKAALTFILRMNLLSCSEVDMFEACMAWACTKSKQTTASKALFKKHIGDLYHDIRFASMTIQEFCALETKYKAVLSTDFNTIIRIISQSEVGSNRFNTAPRQIEWNDKAVLKCDRVFGTDIMKVNLLKTKREMQFSINQPLLLGQFVCCKIGVGHAKPVHDLRTHLPVDVEISEANDWDGTNSKTVLKIKAELQSKDTVVSLPHPILIKPGLFYTIGIGPFAGDHCFYTSELKRNMRLDADIMIDFHKCTVSSSNGKVTGLISAMHFNRI